MTATGSDRARGSASTGALLAAALLSAFAFGWGSAPPPARQEPGAQAWPDLRQEEQLLLFDGWRHFGDTETPEWQEADPRPEAPWLEWRFEAAANPSERALEVSVQHLDAPWTIRLNGIELGALRSSTERLIVPVPPGALRDGDNRIEIRPPQVGDDVTISGLRLYARGYRELLQVAPLRVQVRERGSERALTARLAIQTLDGAAARLHYPEASRRPTRVGVQYVDAAGEALLELAPGRYRITAMRGMEWGIAQAEVVMPAVDAEPILLRLAREVDTTGWIAADTHVHTFTFSGHGDASLDERMLTLAGEGVEVAIATDHNHHTDYAEAQRAAGVGNDFLAVIGNEVTTEIGHFNAFPFVSGAALPDHRLRDWSAVDAEIRARGAQVVILNHPRWPKPAEGPFGVEALDRSSGDFGSGLRLPVDAIEIFNAGEPGDRWMMVLEDWFALLNAGTTATGVASSDSHTVRDMVGQGRTYVRVPNDDPARTTVEQVCAGFRAGATTMSQGLYAEATLNGRGPGSLVPPESGRLRVELRVAGAAWARATRADLFLNGRRVDGAEWQDGGRPFSRTLTFDLAAPAQDAWLVCLAQGPAPDGGWWVGTQTHLAALTNPIWVDADGDGIWSSPRASARRILDLPAAQRARALEAADPAVRAQAAVLEARAARE